MSAQAQPQELQSDADGVVDGKLHPYTTRIHELLAHLVDGPATLPACPSRDALQQSQAIFPVHGGRWDLRARVQPPRPKSAPTPLPAPSPPPAAPPKSHGPLLRASARLTAEDAVAALWALGATSSSAATDALTVGGSVRVDGRRASAALNRAYGRGLVDRELRPSARFGLRGRPVMVWWATKDPEVARPPSRPPTVAQRLDAAQSARQVAMDALRQLGATSRRAGVTTEEVGRAAARPLAYPSRALYSAFERGDVGRSIVSEAGPRGWRQVIRWWITEEAGR